MIYSHCPECGGAGEHGPMCSQHPVRREDPGHGRDWEALHTKDQQTITGLQRELNAERERAVAATTCPRCQNVGVWHEPHPRGAVYDHACGCVYGQLHLEREARQRAEGERDTLRTEAKLAVSVDEGDLERPSTASVAELQAENDEWWANWQTHKRNFLAMAERVEKAERERAAELTSLCALKDEYIEDYDRDLATAAARLADAVGLLRSLDSLVLHSESLQGQKVRAFLDRIVTGAEGGEAGA